MNEDRGWHSKSGVKGQGRLSASQRPSLGPHDKKEPQPSSKGGAGRSQGRGKEQVPTQHPDTIPTPLAEEPVPMDGYNASAVEAAMKASTEPRSSLYKPAEKLHSGGRSASAPWASKPNCMANGKDFWVDLRKQFTALQRSGGTREGG